MKTQHVLIVDDQNEVRQVLRAGLESLGPHIRVQALPSAEEAMLVLYRQMFDLLVIDFRLPGMTGLELMKKVHLRHREARFILITGMQDQRIVRLVAEAGAEAFFSKPLNMNDFLGEVQRILASEAPQGEPKQDAAAASVTAAPVHKPAGAAAPGPVEALERLVKETQASGALLLAAGGRVAVQGGKLPEKYGAAPLAEKLVRLWKQIGALAEEAGGEKPVLSLAAGELNISLGEVNEQHLLALFSPRPRSFSPAEFSAQAAVLRAALQPQPSPVALQPEPDPPQANLEALEEVEIRAEDLQEAEALFQNAPQVLSAAELNNFWDTLEDSELDGNIQENALSYEEALRLGLAPDEG
jgi:CheY-like chemotaxis protein